MESNEKDIVFSRSVKAGKRIYYIDVKKNRKGEFYITVTESKKIIYGEGETVTTSFEKHKIFLYREDLDKFMDSLSESIAYVREHQPIEERPLPELAEPDTDNPPIDFDVDFDSD
ncbi:MAG: PUR family DNA/RNA-binding protein [Prevotellaceae bacterium]|jgi:hypothetical protein|nr:PUR family DNA/RNA-binding protein [Prevotellaceae bacterium]